MPSRFRWILWFALWAALLCAAFALDERCARLSRASVPGEPALTLVRKTRVLWPGHFFFAILAAAIVVAVLRRDRWRQAVFILLSGTMVLVNGLLKWIIGRGRPVNTYPDVQPWVFHPFQGRPGGPNQSMPSGDAALAFAMAAVLSHIFPRGWVVWYLLAVLVAAQRVMVNAHYLSDTVAAAGVGIACAIVADGLLARVWRRSDEPAPIATMPATEQENHG